MNFEYRRQPKITKDDRELVGRLLEIFDEVSFNYNAELLARSTYKLALIGPIVISLWVRERHIKVFREVEDDRDEDLWSGYLHELGLSDDLDWPYTELMRPILAKIAHKIQDAYGEQPTVAEGDAEPEA